MTRTGKKYFVFFIFMACTTMLHAQGLDEVLEPGDYPSQIIIHRNYTTSFNPLTKVPNWVSWSITKEELISQVSRKDFSFVPDPDVLGDAVTAMDYSRSGFDRGHMCPAADNKWDSTAMQESFYMTNICPQDHTLNEKTWCYLETACRSWANNSAVYVVCGPYFKSKPTKTIGNAKVAVPNGFWKVVLRRDKGEWRAIGFLIPNTPCEDDFDTYAVSVDEVERITGLDFFSALNDSIEDSIESSFSLSHWPHSKH